MNDRSCRLPLLVLFVSAAVWLVLGSAFSLIASLKFHSPNFLADCAWLTYGRVRPACNNSLLYGFCLQAGLGVALWLFTRLGGTTLAQRWLVTVGAILWNAGVTAGVLGILAGDSTGFENLEMPRYGALVLFLGYLMVGLGGVLTFHQRRQRALFASQWFLLAALFWFPWIYSTAELLLVMFPVRGVAQAVIAWWYSGNLQVVWLGLVGVATVFYFLPKLTERELHSGYLAQFAFWTLILFGSWCGIPNSAPLPAWMPALSTVASVLTIIPIVTVALNIYGTLRGGRRTLQPPASSLQPPVHRHWRDRLHGGGFDECTWRAAPSQPGDRFHLVHPCQSPARFLWLLCHGHVWRDLLYRAATSGNRVSVAQIHPSSFLAGAVGNPAHGCSVCHRRHRPGTRAAKCDDPLHGGRKSDAAFPAGQHTG